MSEIATPTPEVAAPTPVATPAAPAPAPKTSDRGRDARRAAAMAAPVPTDDAPAEENSEIDKPQGGSEPSADLQAKEPKAEAKTEDKPAASPELQARMLADRMLQAERKRWDDREAEYKARLADSDKTPKNAIDADSVHREVSTDIAAYADKRKLTPEQRKQMANELWYSAVPEDKRPAGWKSGSTQVLSEVEQLKAELEKTRGEVKTWQETQAQERAKAENESRAMAMGEEILKGAPANGADYAKAFAAKAPAVAKRELAMLAHEMVTIERETAEREYREPRRLTEADVLNEYDKRWEQAYEQQWGWAHEVRAKRKGTPAPVPAANGVPPKVPSAAATASPTSPARNGKLTREDRRREALESLNEK